MPKLSRLKATDSHLAWCPHCKDEFVTYNLALAKCPRCGGTARTGLRGLAVKTLMFLVVGAVVAVIGAGIFMFLKNRGVIGSEPEGPAAEEPAPAQ